MYYVFISLFLLLSGLDSLEDTITDLLEYEDYYVLILITHSLILILYIPFVTIGFLMAKSRMKTSWDDR